MSSDLSFSGPLRPSATSPKSLQDLGEAEQNFIEAIRRSKHARIREREARRLKLSMRKAFRIQGKRFVRAFSKFRDRFTEAASVPSAFGNDHAVTFQESVPASEWSFVFYVTAQDTLDIFAKPIQRAAEVSMLAGADAMIADLGMQIRFDLQNPRAIKYLEDYGARQVTKINDITRDFLNTLITQATEEGWSYKRTAEAIIERYEEFAIGRPQEHIDSRAHHIAVTETGNAYAEGNLSVARDLKAAGIQMEKFWSTVGDNKVSEGCQENEAIGWIEIDEAFPSGHLRPLRFPGCRCDLLTRRKEKED